MDFSYIEEFENGVIIKEVRNFELPHIFDCGQCFRWSKESNGNYIGVAHEKVIEIEKNGEDVILYNSTKKDFDNIWMEYFDLRRDYGEIKDILRRDPILSPAVDFGYGIRLLKQESFEIVLSFIISANNRIPMIRRCINKISEKFGEELQYKGKKYYTFPKVEKLTSATVEDFEECGAGFRAKYLKDTVEKIYNTKNADVESFDEIYDLYLIKDLDADKCHEALQSFSGIGPKVADCIMLFSMEKYSAFPVDVWVKKAMAYFYGCEEKSLKKTRDFGRERFGELSGFAQQYLFYYARENKISVE